MSCHVDNTDAHLSVNNNYERIYTLKSGTSLIGVFSCRLDPDCPLALVITGFL